VSEITNWTGKPFPRESVLAHVGKGWHPLVNRLIDDLFALGWDGSLHQIKEKFGGLRFYTGAISDAMRKRIHEAESESIRTCEDCGAEGKLRYGSWIQTLCDEHALGRKAFNENDEDE
jgi:hypothetical protein